MAKRIAVLITSFNRRNTTLAALKALFSQKLPPDHVLDVFLLDDGSTDGTGEAVRSLYPQIHVSQGSGSLYWGGGMRKVWKEALLRDPSFYLWLNDDTSLDEGALLRMLETFWSLNGRIGSHILVGATRDPNTGVHNYGGLIRTSRFRRLRFMRLQPGDEPIRCESMNGNCVLVPSEIVEKVGIFSSQFTHYMADIDYGLRTVRAGFSIWILPGFVGTCHSNSIENTWQDRTLGMSQVWKKVRSPKGLPPNEWRTFSKEHAGALWPLYWLSPYVSMFLRIALYHFTKGTIGSHRTESIS